jgi:hypothetical protein
VGKAGFFLRLRHESVMCLDTKRRKQALFTHPMHKACRVLIQ